MFPKVFDSETTVYTEQGHGTVCSRDIMINPPSAQPPSQCQRVYHSDKPEAHYHWQYYTSTPTWAPIETVECVHYVNNSFFNIRVLYSLRFPQ